MSNNTHNTSEISLLANKLTERWVSAENDYYNYLISDFFRANSEHETTQSETSYMGLVRSYNNVAEAILSGRIEIGGRHD